MNIHSINCEYTDEVMFDVMKSGSWKQSNPGLLAWAANAQLPLWRELCLGQLFTLNRNFHWSCGVYQLCLHVQGINNPPTVNTRCPLVLWPHRGRKVHYPQLKSWKIFHWAVWPHRGRKVHYPQLKKLENISLSCVALIIVREAPILVMSANSSYVSERVYIKFLALSCPRS